MYSTTQSSYFQQSRKKESFYSTPAAESRKRTVLVHWRAVKRRVSFKAKPEKGEFLLIKQSLKQGNSYSVGKIENGLAHCRIGNSYHNRVGKKRVHFNRIGKGDLWLTAESQNDTTVPNQGTNNRLAFLPHIRVLNPSYVLQMWFLTR